MKYRRSCRIDQMSTAASRRHEKVASVLSNRAVAGVICIMNRRGKWIPWRMDPRSTSVYAKWTSRSTFRHLKWTLFMKNGLPGPLFAMQISHSEKCHVGLAGRHVCMGKMVQLIFGWEIDACTSNPYRLGYLPVLCTFFNRKTLFVTLRLGPFYIAKSAVGGGVHFSL